MKRLKELYMHYFKWYKNSYSDWETTIYTKHCFTKEEWKDVSWQVFRTFRKHYTIKQIVSHPKYITKTRLRTGQEWKRNLKYFIPNKK